MGSKGQLSVVALASIALSCSRPSPAPSPLASVTVAPDAQVSARPDVVSSASTPWEGGAPVVASGSVDGAALRRTHRARIEADRSPVTVLQGATALELGTRICEASVPKRAPETPILIKPNLGGIEWFKDPDKNAGDDGIVGRTTNPEFVRGIVRCLKARGHERITIAEGFAHAHADWERLVRTSGYEAMAKEESVALVAMDDDGVFDVAGDQPGKPLAVRGMEQSRVPTLLVPKILAEHLEHGMFISAPKLKAHRFAVVSLGIKGMQGTVMLSDASPAFHQKWRTHRELASALGAIKDGKPDARKRYVEALEIFSERMADLLEVAAPDVVLAEGAPAMGGDGFSKQWPSAEKIAVGGTNPILVDRVGAAVLGLWDNEDLGRELLGHKTSPLIEIAAKRFNVDLAKPNVTGDAVALLAGKRPVHLVGMAGFDLHSDAKPATPPSRGDKKKPELHAAHADAPPRIDGAPDDAIWKRATPVRFDTDWSGASTGITTTVRAAWAKDALYVLWELAGAGLEVDRSRPANAERERLYEEDCVELFFTPDPKVPTRYFEIEVGPFGHFFDIDVDRAAKNSNVAWSSAPEIQAKQDAAAHTAVIEAAFRSPDVTAALAAGAKLPFALYRMEGKGPRKYLAWSPTRTAKPDFHVPEAFGTLVLE